MALDVGACLVDMIHIVTLFNIAAVGLTLPLFQGIAVGYPSGSWIIYYAD